jgi:hypothetical protein
MSTTINLPLPIDLPPPRSRTNEVAPFYARIDFGILMLWAVTMLTVGAVARFGAQSSEFSAFELLAPF